MLEEVIYNFITFVASFLLVLGIYTLTLKRRVKKDENALSKTTEMLYLKQKYSVDIDKLTNKMKIKLIAVSNAFIISLVFLVLSFIRIGIIIRIFIGMLFLIPIIIIVYHIIGIKLKKGGY